MAEEEKRWEKRPLETDDAYLERVFGQEPELVPVTGQEGENPSPKSLAQKETETPVEPGPSETPDVVNPEPKNGKASTTLLFGADSGSSTEETVIIGGRKKDSTRISRRFVKPKYYSGDTPLGRVMTELLFDSLGLLHDELGDSMRDIIGDSLGAVVPEFEYNGELRSGASYRTPFFRVVVKDRSLGTELILNGSDEPPPEKIGEIIKTNPVTNTPFTRGEQMDLKRIKVCLETYAKGGIPELPKRMYEPVEKSEHEAVKGYSGLQSIAHVIKQLAEQRFGEIGGQVGKEFVCRVLEVEQKGMIYRVNDIWSPPFRVERKTKDGGSEEYVWLVPVDVDCDKGINLGQLFRKSPEGGKDMGVMERSSLKVRVELEEYDRTDNPPKEGAYESGTPAGRKTSVRRMASFDYVPPSKS